MDGYKKTKKLAYLKFLYLHKIKKLDKKRVILIFLKAN